MNFTPDQKRVIEAQNCDLLVSAAAGSGKTAVLVERIIQMISDKENPLDVERLLVVTFTKAAAAQMKEKIEKALEKKLNENPENPHFIRQMNYINYANILTIDSFCYRVVREHFYLLGIDPGIRIGETGEIGLMRQEILERVIEEYYGSNPNFVAFSDAFSADKNDERIEDYILKAYEISASYPRPFLWTREAREKLAPKDEAAFCAMPHVRDYFEEVRRSAEEIKKRILDSLETIRGIDGPAYMERAFLSDVAFLEDIVSAKTYTHFFECTGVKFANIGRGKKGSYDEGLAEKLKKTRDAYKEEIKNLLSAFTLPMEAVLAQMQEQVPMLAALLDIVDDFRNAFLEEKLSRNVLEFSDVEHFALQVLSEGYDETGMPVPSRVAHEYAEQFEEILIDEYQDSNFLQEAILSCVSRHDRGEHNMFMVGDVKQSIYSFRMARPDLFMEKYHAYSDAETAAARKLLLKNNFRSSANILFGINYMFYQLMDESLGGITYTDDEALVPGKHDVESIDDCVEIMIGESKNFDFLLGGSPEVSPEKEENLDEDLEDIGRMELEASMIARRIREMMGKGDGKQFMVTEGDGIRPLTYGDIVLLLRAPSAFSMIFSQTLMNQGIPVNLQNEKGYFDTVEIRTVLSLLRVLDNPLNEIELAAVLRSYFCGLNSDEMALLVLIKRWLKKEMQKESGREKSMDVSLFETMKKLVGNVNQKGDGDNALAAKSASVFSEYQQMLYEGVIPKCRKLNMLLETLKKRMADQRLSDCIAFIYDETAYGAYVSVMPEGKRRMRNLELFLTEAEEYEKKKCGSLFAFLCYVDKLEQKSITLGGDPADNYAENAVRIMSIHRSKGLEFPVVFLAGIGKQFNMVDTKNPLIIHSDYHFGAKYRNPEKRCGNDSFSRKAIAARMLTENIAEELRIFYVGLTRAKDKLILTGVTPDIVAQIQKYENVTGLKEQKLSYGVVHTARSYLDFVVMSMIRNPVFCDAMKLVRKRMDKKGEHVLSAEYENKNPIVLPECKFAVQVYDFKSLLVAHMKTAADDHLERISTLQEWAGMPELNKGPVKRILSWEYDGQFMTKQKSKMSVTEIKRIYETDFEPPDILDKTVLGLEEYNPPLPEFIAGNRPLNAATKGMWVHKAMELFDFANLKTEDEINKALEGMRKEGRLIEETKEFISADMLLKLVNSELGRRMQAAAKGRKLYKEKRFVVGVPVSRLLKDTGDCLCTETAPVIVDAKPVVVQGIIDAYFEEEGNLILLDYKTDYVKAGQEDVLKSRYDTQLRYYKDTLEQLTGRKVAETYIYSFTLEKAIRLF